MRALLGIVIVLLALILASLVWHIAAERSHLDASEARAIVDLNRRAVPARALAEAPAPEERHAAPADAQAAEAARVAEERRSASETAARADEAAAVRRRSYFAVAAALEDGGSFARVAPDLQLAFVGASGWSGRELGLISHASQEMARWESLNRAANARAENPAETRPAPWLWTTELEACCRARIAAAVGALRDGDAAQAHDYLTRIDDVLKDCPYKDRPAGDAPK